MDDEFDSESDEICRCELTGKFGTPLCVWPTLDWIKFAASAFKSSPAGVETDELCCAACCAILYCSKAEFCFNLASNDSAIELTDEF